MPDDRCYFTFRPLTWKRMDRYQRKQFHRENEARRIRGLQPLRKP